MSKVKHTPGPWRVAKKLNRREWPFPAVQGKNGAMIAQTCVVGAKGAANAYLIADAPELLTMLKSARECIAYCRRAHKDIQSEEGGMPIEFFIDGVIAKAEGRAS